MILFKINGIVGSFMGIEFHYMMHFVAIKCYPLRTLQRCGPKWASQVKTGVHLSAIQTICKARARGV